MIDIQTRLELEAAAREDGSDIFYEAANEIELLRAERDLLREDIKLLDELWHEYHDACVSQLEENDRLKRALVFAAIPLEAMILGGTDKLHTKEMQESISYAVNTIRTIIKETGHD